VYMQIMSFDAQKKAFLGVALIVLVALPVLSFGKSGVIYVDEDAKGDQDGSQKRPYKKISKALDKAKKGTEVRVKSGTYEENITLPSGVKLTSDSNNRDKVIIKGDNDKATVTMKQGSKISAVTVRDGRNGIRVESDAKAHIYNVTIKGAKRDGIHAEAAKVDESKRLLVDKVYITKSGMAGIYSKKRMITILSSDVDANLLDGIDIQGGSKSWIENTRSRWNGHSGLKAVIDGSSILTKGSSFRNNGAAGVEAISFGGNGTVGIKKGTIVGNAQYGVAKVQKQGSFRGLDLGVETNGIHFDGNKKGNVSGLLSSF
jgi:hypothetical protein